LNGEWVDIRTFAGTQEFAPRESRALLIEQKIILDGLNLLTPCSREQVKGYSQLLIERSSPISGKRSFSCGTMRSTSKSFQNLAVLLPSRRKLSSELLQRVIRGGLENSSEYIKVSDFDFDGPDFHNRVQLGFSLIHTSSHHFWVARANFVSSDVWTDKESTTSMQNDPSGLRFGRFILVTTAIY
jgi:hypothetical protein